MKLLIMSGPLFPNAGNNANLVKKLVPYLLEKNHEVKWFSSAFDIDQRILPKDTAGIPIYWCIDHKDIKRTLVFPMISKVKDPKGFSDELQVQIYLRELKRIRKVYPFEAVLSTSEPYSMTVAASKLIQVCKINYLMDPPAVVSHGKQTIYRNKTLSDTLRKQNVLLTTPFIKKALAEHDIDLSGVKTIECGFPMIQENEPLQSKRTEGKIKLLFTGWLYSDIRSPKYFLDLASHLDERFQITFMGRECENLKEQFSFKSKTKIISLPQQPYETAIKAMKGADILINIGNSVPVHMPSKTLEYINTGKPIVNFYKFEDCPTLYYTKRYPLALNLYEEDKNVEKATDQFIQFCEENINKTVNRDYIVNEYKDCTPEYIAKMICDALER